MCHKTTLASDTLIDFQIDFSISIERFYTSAGNPIKEILLKLNLPDHRSILTDSKILKDGGEVKEFQRSFCHSDTERLSRSDEVLKLKNFKKDATLKLSKSTNQEWYEHVGPEVTRSQDGKTRLCLVDDLTVLKITSPLTTWKMSDIKGIDPMFCTHKILMEDNVKPTVQHKRRVNPKIHEVIKKEVIKLLEADLIYLISDSPWVSSVHCVPKKGGITVIENDDNELIPTRLLMG
ncbi:hypothetical protein Tco_1116186 [Tanacetum coccineum]